MVPKEGIEPSQIALHDFESCASTNSATSAIIFYMVARGRIELPTQGFSILCSTTELPRLDNFFKKYPSDFIDE